MGTLGSVSGVNTNTKYHYKSVPPGQLVIHKKIIMKIDLDNNYTTFRQESKQNSVITTWYQAVGLTVQDIETHPCLSDLAILIHIREAYWLQMDPSQRGFWSGCWGVVYRRKTFLRDKTFEKLKTLVAKLIDRDKLLYEQRLKIKSLRQTNTEPLKRDHDNEAKGSHSHSLHKRTVINERALECPYL